MWRKDIEGYSKFYYVQNRVKPKLSFRTSKMGRHIIQYSDELQKLIYEWSRYPSTDTYNKDAIFNWMIIRTIGILIYNRFRCYLKIAEKQLNTGILDIDSSLFEEEIPFFIFLYPDEKNPTCRMHHWIDDNYKDIDAISAEIMCPFENKNERRKDKSKQGFQYYKHEIELGADI